MRSRGKPSYFSHFGGLWPDRSDAPELLAHKVEKGLVTEREAERLRGWIANGFTIIEDAFEPALIDAYVRDLDATLTNPDPRIIAQVGIVNEMVHLSRDILKPGDSVRICDHYVFSEPARSLLMAPVIERYLRVLFEESPLLFQSLGFEYGSQQGFHQDTAYVVTDPPMGVVGVWIALEDVQEGSGELQYIAGSHRIPEYLFSKKYKHYKADRDGPDQEIEWGMLLVDNAKKMGLETIKFRPRKGTILFWHADLVHGGAEITRKGATRRSLVGHYCPASSTPHYHNFVEPLGRAKLPYDGSFYSSHFYPVMRPDILALRLG